MEEKNQMNHVVNHFEAGSNCQVFNGDVTSSVFALPGAIVTQQSCNKGAVPQPATGKRGRPLKAGKKTQKSFIYQAYDEEETNLRLQSLFHALLQLQWIAPDTKQKSFMSIFSGEDTACRVTWTGDINTLAELFKELVTRKGYVKLPEGESIWVMVNARFWEKEGNREFGNDRLRSTSAPTGSKDTIDLLVKLMNPDLPLESLREAMLTQR